MSAYRTLLLLLAVCSLAACRSPRKAIARDCFKAQRIMAAAEVRVAHLCPSALVRGDSVHLQADSLAAAVRWITIPTDSALDACADYAATVAWERDSLAMVLDGAAQAVLAAPRRTAPALAQLRERVCAWEPFRVENDWVIVDVRMGATEPLLKLTRKAKQLACPPCVQRKVPVTVDSGVAPLWRTTALVLLAALLLSLLFAILALRRAGKDDSDTPRPFDPVRPFDPLDK